MGNNNSASDTNKARAKRQTLGLSLDEAGRRAQIERSRLCRYELGYVGLGDLELARLARVLGVRVLPPWTGPGTRRRGKGALRGRGVGNNRE